MTIFAFKQIDPYIPMSNESPTNDKPVLGGHKPVVTDLEPGSYWWCVCGRSANQPYCDGSHAGTDFTPLEVKIDETKKVALCTCKQTKNSPFCDGTHGQYKDRQIGDQV